MFMAAALALADLSPAKRAANAPLLPAIKDLRDVAAAVARNVARQAQKERVADDLDPVTLDTRIREMMWRPEYRLYQRKRAPTEVRSTSSR